MTVFNLFCIFLFSIPFFPSFPFPLLTFHSSCQSLSSISFHRPYSQIIVSSSIQPFLPFFSFCRSLLYFLSSSLSFHSFPFPECRLSLLFPSRPLFPFPPPPPAPCFRYLRRGNIKIQENISVFDFVSCNIPYSFPSSSSFLKTKL